MSIMKKQPAPQFDVFLSHNRVDKPWAAKLKADLARYGLKAWLDKDEIRPGNLIVSDLDLALKNSRAVAIIISPEAMTSGWVEEEYAQAIHLAKEIDDFQVIPVVYRNTTLPGFLKTRNFIDCQDETTYNQSVWQLAWGISGQRPKQVLDVISDLPPPLPFTDTHFIEQLEIPGGAIRAQSEFYVNRPADTNLFRELMKPYGTTVTIRAPRQTGKTSLLIKAVVKARQADYQIVHLDFQRVGSDTLATADTFLHYLATTLIRQLKLDLSELDQIWSTPAPLFDKLNYLLEDYILPTVSKPIVLAMDEMDGLLSTPFHDDFFSMIRFWHNNRAINPLWDKLNVVMVISTEPHLLIQDINRSPFNIGLSLKLSDYDQQQISDLNQKYHCPLTPSQQIDLMDLLGGHPYLTQQALYTLVKDNLNWDQLIALAETDNSPFDDHLQRYLWLLDERPALNKAMKQVINHHTCPQKEFYQLLQAGLVSGNSQQCHCRCRLYNHYFGSRLS
ncbi:MAG: hypothetical protein ACI8WB_001130 [Phenylobacterium sp.]|jgi:hypothetical protein